MKKKMIKLAVLLAVIAAVAAIAVFLLPRKLPKGTFQTTGIIEGTEVNLSPKITERIKEIRFQEGDYVKEGETAILLDPEKKAAEYEQAQANLDVAKAGERNAAADIEKAKVRITDTKRDLERNTRLLEKKLVAQNDVDKAQTAYDTAVADLNKAEAQKAYAEAGVKQSEAVLRVAKVNLDDTVINSTISGVVTLRAFEPGEFAAAGSTVLTIVDLGNIWLRVDMEETAVSRVKLGDIVKIKADSLPEKWFTGRVTEINSEGEFATQRDVKRGRQDIKTFRVKVRIDEPKGLLKQGMTATATFGDTR
ncbi:MAG: efflux RND transporter periplasmic adaptor subunit [Candidatus Omnitrophica bacterium]|nr:efflux RND transporter periplasmic adaptor subunit [Candidatus Omnitrophota bacterium]